MNAYYVDYPRDFCNEYTVYVTSDPAGFLAVVPTATRISRAEAVRLGHTRPRQARRDGEQWFGGWFGDVISWGPYDTLREEIADALRATDTMIELESVAGY